MNWKKLGKKLLFPSIGLILMFMLLSTILLIMVFVKGWSSLPLASIVYVFAFYTLTVCSIACWKTVPNYYTTIKNKIYQNTYTNRYLTDVAFKTHINLYRSFVMNLLYVMTNIVSALVYHTNWFGIIAVYYGTDL